MRTDLVLVVTLLMAVVVAGQQRYTSRFDGIDIDRILNNKRLVANYVDCLVGRKRCPPEGTELKKILPDALATRCAKCTPQQRDAAVKVIRRLKQGYPEQWNLLVQQWDPTGEYLKQLEESVKGRADVA